MTAWKLVLCSTIRPMVTSLCKILEADAFEVVRSAKRERYPLPVAPLISRFADSAVLLKRRPKTLPQLPRGSVYIIYESIQRLEA